MNLMSPLGWALYHKRHNTVIQYIEFFKDMAKILPREAMADHAVIFYSSIKQLI